VAKRAQVAQLVEQRTENPRVTGSIPVLGTTFLAIISSSHDSFGTTEIRAFHWRPGPKLISNSSRGDSEMVTPQNDNHAVFNMMS
jgi:hypothetical protein